jgi:hypothetical protein
MSFIIILQCISNFTRLNINYHIKKVHVLFKKLFEPFKTTERKSIKANVTVERNVLLTQNQF